MNRFDEVTGNRLQGDSPTKHFGQPLPGDPSIMYTIEKNQLIELEQRFKEMGNMQTGKFTTEMEPPSSAENVFQT